ncbi:MAG: T9SS type A sorting domain-containing protein [Bacteroidetes bacterium]|nr:T9SS type A sorting domain-containing protein [Bacteroidota bacterium]
MRQKIRFFSIISSFLLFLPFQFFASADDCNLPVAVCNDYIQVALDADGTVAFLPEFLDEGSYADCGLQSLSTSITSVDCSDVGPAFPVSLTITDINGDTATCWGNVEVVDNIGSVAVCDALITVSLDASGSATLVPSMIDAGSTDNCQLTYSLSGQTSFDCSDVGSDYVVFLHITDTGGTTNSCWSTVSIVDNLDVCCSGPVAVCNATLNVALDPSGNATIDPSLIDGGSFGECPIVSYELDITEFDCSDVGSPTTVFMTIEDSQGNSNSCWTEVTIGDLFDPVAICNATLSVSLDASGSLTLDPALIDAGSYDNCPITFSLSPATLSCGDPVTNTVQLTVSDPDGNFAYCFSQVTISNPDSDGDGLTDPCDNCPLDSNQNQADADGDGVGNQCDQCPNEDDQADPDGDGIPGCIDNCPLNSNPDQADADGDEIGDVCDNCPNDSNANQKDNDGDGVGNKCDNCINVPNPDQTDTDGDGKGDACDNKSIWSNVGTAPWLKPNPMTDVLHIGLDLETDKYVRIRIFDLSGRMIREVFSGELPAGPVEVSWDGLSPNGKVSGGLYFIRIDQGDKTTVHKLVVE